MYLLSVCMDVPPLLTSPCVLQWTAAGARGACGRRAAWTAGASGAGTAPSPSRGTGAGPATAPDWGPVTAPGASAYRVSGADVSEALGPERWASRGR